MRKHVSRSDRGRALDRVTKSLLNEFVTENLLQTLPEDQAFEHFCGYLVTSEHYSETFSTTDIAVGAGGDCGIDCVAIIVNGSLVTNPEEIEDLEEANGYLDVTFVFVQAERSSSFDTAKLAHFGFGVGDFFSDTPQLPRNDEIALAGRTVNSIFNRSARFRGNPRCYLYYTTTGRCCYRSRPPTRAIKSDDALKGIPVIIDGQHEARDRERQ